MRPTIYWTNIFLTLHYAFLLYINSSFLGQFFSADETGLLYTASAIIGIFSLLEIPKLINRYRRFWVCLVLFIFTALCALALAYTRDKVLLAGLFILGNGAIMILRFLMDVYLEQYSEDKQTGHIRGIGLTTANAAIAVSPFIVGMLVKGDHFEKVYTASTLLLLPAIAIVLARFRSIPHQHYDNHNILAAIRHILSRSDLRAMIFANFLLEFFYTWMVIYTPVYLATVIGFSWPAIGIIFSIMLLPFVFFELPLGRIADSVLGESDVLSIGFFILALFTGALAFIHSKDLVMWALLLFMTRTGAAAVEVMTESRFFKGISAKDANLIGMFRAARPVALLIAPVVGALIIRYAGYQGIYISLAFLMLYGMRYGFAIRG